VKGKIYKKVIFVSFFVNYLTIKCIRMLKIHHFGELFSLSYAAKLITINDCRIANRSVAVFLELFSGDTQTN
jgi:hypothetical protein